MHEMFVPYQVWGTHNTSFIVFNRTCFPSLTDTAPRIPPLSMKLHCDCMVCSFRVQTLSLSQVGGNTPATSKNFLEHDLGNCSVRTWRTWVPSVDFASSQPAPAPILPETSQTSFHSPEFNSEPSINCRFGGLVKIPKSGAVIAFSAISNYCCLIPVTWRLLQHRTERSFILGKRRTWAASVSGIQQHLFSHRWLLCLLYLVSCTHFNLQPIT